MHTSREGTLLLLYLLRKTEVSQVEIVEGNGLAINFGHGHGGFSREGLGTAEERDACCPQPATYHCC